MRKQLFILPLLCFYIALHSQSNIDVQHYKFEIELSDKSDTISCVATIDIKFLSASDSVSLDLPGRNSPVAKEC